MRDFQVNDRVIFYVWHDHHMNSCDHKPGKVAEVLNARYMLEPDYKVLGDDGEYYYGDWCDMRLESCQPL